MYARWRSCCWLILLIMWQKEHKHSELCTDGQGVITPHRRCVSRAATAVKFWLLKNGFDRLTNGKANFCPWPVNQRPAARAQRLGHASLWSLIVPCLTVWPPPQSALTVWLHFDRGRSAQIRTKAMMRTRLIGLVYRSTATNGLHSHAATCEKHMIRMTWISIHMCIPYQEHDISTFTYDSRARLDSPRAHKAPIRWILVSHPPPACSLWYRSTLAIVAIINDIHRDFSLRIPS